LAERAQTPISRSSFLLTDRDAFDAALDACIEWTKRTADREIDEGARTDARFELDDPLSPAKVAATRLDDSTGKIWAAQVSFVGDTTAPRTWVTDLFVESRAGDLTRFGAQLVCKHEKDDPGFEHSRPRIIREIIGHLSAEADGVSLGNEFAEVAEQDVEQFSQLLGRPDRRLPIVLASVDDAGGAQIDLERLAKRISGTAHLRTMKTDASYELSRSVGKQMSTFDGAVRLYLPNVDLNNEDHLRHPIWFAPRSGWNPRAAHQILSRVLPYGFRDAEAGTRFWRLGLLRQAVTRAEADAATQGSEDKSKAELSALRAEVENAKEDVRNAEALMNDEAQKLEEAETEVSRLERENYDLRQRIRGLEQAAPGASIALSENDISDLADGDPSLESSLSIIASVFPDRIVVLQSAIESARDSSIFSHKKRAFDLLWRLSTTYYTALSSGESDSSAKKCFGDRYAAKEKETISKAGRERRTFEYVGQQIEMMRHLKIGTADNKADTLRVHFEWLAAQGKIVIGHCGGHLDF